MRILISPAKKMRVDTDGAACRGLPVFCEQAQQLCARLQGMSRDELKRLWKCSDPLVELNMDRLRSMDLHSRLTPAVWAYEGLQYQHMLPEAFTDQEAEYVQQHLRILSGLYGLLRPYDGVTPYRLEMQAQLSFGEIPDLYAFWGDRIARQLMTETDCILNLASREYSLSVSRHLPPDVRFVTCVFGEKKNGRIVEKGTLCKMARGEMVRYLAETRAERPEAAQGFSRLQFRYSQQDSDGNTFVFLAG